MKHNVQLIESERFQQTVNFNCTELYFNLCLFTLL